MHPAASAEPTLVAIVVTGQFHGVISAATPIGSLTTSVPPSCRVKSASFSAASADSSICRPNGACLTLHSHCGAPISWWMASAMSSMRALYSAISRDSTSTRVSRVVADQAGKAARAAATAASTSAAPPMATRPITASVAGLTMSRRPAPAAGATHWPPI
ncbi:hypothetical protein D3C86_1661590 [compost metagenome]